MRMKMFTFSAICALIAADMAAVAALIIRHRKNIKLSGGVYQ